MQILNDDIQYLHIFVCISCLFIGVYLDLEGKKRGYNSVLYNAEFTSC